MKKLFKKKGMYKIMSIVNCLAICLVSYNANLACDWLYYQDEEPESVKRFRKF